MVAKESPYIASTYEQLQIISQDPQKRLEYDAHLKAQLDRNQMVREAEERGIAKGREGGMKKTQRQMIQTMRKTMSIEQIAAGLELSIVEVQQILQAQ